VIEVTSKGFLASHAIAALHSMGFPTVGAVSAMARTYCRPARLNGSRDFCTLLPSDKETRLLA
jgi:hypothetical protein